MQNVSDLIFAAGMALPSPSTPIAVQYDLLLLTFVFRELFWMPKRTWYVTSLALIFAISWWAVVFILM